MREMILRAFMQAHENFTRMLAEFLPRFLVMLIIIVIGWLAAWLFKLIFRAILRLARVEKVSEEAGASRLLREADLPSMTELLSRAVFWAIWLGFFIIGVSVLGIVSLQKEISDLIGLLPQVFVAFVVLFVGILAANFFSRAALLGAVNAGFPSPKLLSETVRIVIGFLAVAMALEQVGLGRQTVEIAFAILFGGIMLGLAIAFGLGGRRLAQRFLEKRFHPEGKSRNDELSPL
ncbi:MAG TPA: hypothetical protein VMV61_04715 [Patescibacteria group bacterium]|nr:hypothetical protein [Patescibacteria group bacterium]